MIEFYKKILNKVGIHIFIPYGGEVKMEVLLLLLVMFLFSITGLFLLGYTYSFVMKKLFHR